MKHTLYSGLLLLMLIAIVAMLLHEGPVALPEPVCLEWPETPSLLPDVVLHSVRTMNETAFFKVIGKLHNKGVNPVGPVVVRGRFVTHSDEREISSMAFALPEIIVPGAAASFELVVPEHPEIARVHMDFQLLGGESLPVDARQVRTNKAGLQ